MNRIWMICLTAGVAMAQMPMESHYTSPAANTTVAFGDKQVRINYHAPSMHGREILAGWFRSVRCGGRGLIKPRC